MNLIHVLTKGWLFRIFSTLLFLLAIGVQLFLPVPEIQNTYGVAALVLFANFFLMGTVGHRIIFLSQQHSADVIPDYYLKIKNALKQLLLFSCVTTIIFLPDVFMVLGLMTWLFVIFLFLTMTFIQPKSWFLFSALCFMLAFGENKWTLEQVTYYLFQLPAYFLPVVILISYKLIESLDSFKMTEQARQRYAVYSGLTVTCSLNHTEKVPEKSRTRIQQWIINTNLSALRGKLEADEKLNKTALVDIASTSISQFGLSALIGWSVAIALFCIYQFIFPLSASATDNFYMTFFAMFSVCIVAMGSMMSFFFLNERKEYLAKLRLTPLFTSEREFTGLLLKVFFIKQGKLLLFTLLSSGVIIFMVWPNAREVFANTVAINIASFCFYSAIALFGWHTQKQIKYLIMVIMMLFFILLIPLAIISYDQHIFLLFNDLFIVVMLIGVILLSLALLKWKYGTASWRKLV